MGMIYEYVCNIVYERVIIGYIIQIIRIFKSIKYFI